MRKKAAPRRGQSRVRAARAGPFPAGKADEVSISAMRETVLQRGKWWPNGAQANKPNYEQLHEVMKQNELFDISIRSCKMKKVVRGLHDFGLKDVQIRIFEGKI